MNDLQTLWLPLAVATLALIVLLADVMMPPREHPSRVLGFVVAGGLAGIFGASFFVHADGTAAHGAYQASAWTIFLQRVFLAAGALAALGGVDDVAQRTPKRSGEYWLMLLSSLVGMSLLAGARNLVLVVVGFELMGLPLYVLAAYAKNEEKKSLASEAAIKLYLVGATSSAITLFGLALLVGMSGTTRLSELAAAEMSPLASVGAVLVLAGVGYKIGMVPFHMWVPDTYQGARAPFVAFLSVAPKVAGVAVLAQIFLLGLGTHPSAWRPALAVLAFASMAVGNVLALMQTDLRRLLGYSGIAQMGYVLVAVAANDAESTGMTLFFLAAYTFTNMGAFLVVHAASDGTYEVASLAGLSKRSPLLAGALLAFLLSLAGIPFVIGFWAKLYVFLAAWRAGMAPLVVAAIVLAVLALFYYLRVLRAAFMAADAPSREEGEGQGTATRVGMPLRLAVAVCALAVVGLGLWPAPLVGNALDASHALSSQPGE